MLYNFQQLKFSSRSYQAALPVQYYINSFIYNHVHIQPRFRLLIRLKCLMVQYLK